MVSSQAKYSTLMLVVGIVLGYLICSAFKTSKEGFDDSTTNTSSNSTCNSCGTTVTCPPCREPDLSKYVLRASVPPCPAMPDFTKYMLKTECPPVPDLSNYVLKSSVPRQQPIILDCSKCSKSKGECPPCPRPRCPEVSCPEPAACPLPAPCPRTKCPNPVVKCRAEDSNNDGGIRPFLAPLDAGFN